MHDNSPDERLSLKVAVTATQTGFATTQDGGVIAVLFDDFALIWPANYTSSEPLRNARSISLLGHPGAVIALHLRGATHPAGAKEVSASLQVMHQNDGVESIVIPTTDLIDHRVETSFGVSGRLQITVSAIIHPQLRAGHERQIHFDSLDITVLQR